MRKWMTVALAGALFTLPGRAQSPGFEFDWSKLAPKAVEHVEVSLDSNMLRLAGQFLRKGGDPDQNAVKDLLQNLRGVYVRSFRFANEGEYSLTDVDKFRSQFNGGGWNKIVDVRSTRPGGENTGVYLKSNGEEIQGIVVIAAEKKELTVVNILGNIRPDQIQQLGGKFGIPEIGIPDEAKKQLKKNLKNKDEDDE